MKKGLLALTLAASTVIGYAQQTADTADSAETTAAATAQPDSATTEPAITYARSTATLQMTSGALAARARNTSAMLEQRWQAEERIYREAGLSDDKIQKLKAITEELYSKQSSGERFDYTDMRKRRMEILTQEDMQKLRELSAKQFGSRTTGTRETRTAPDTSTTTSSE